MKRILLLLSLIFISVFGNASVQSDSPIVGHIMDIKQNPVPFAVVSLLKAEDSSLVKGMITDDLGNFSFEYVKSGKYLLEINASGFSKTTEGPFDVNADEKKIIPDIVLTASKELEDVEIAAVMPLFTQRADMLIMNIENSPVRIIGTAWDLLSTVPGVVVDQNSGITLKGKSGVMIYIDGRNTFLSGDQLQSYLQGISAADIIRIEIISNPSAKYDAQGSGGILNLITRKGSQQGFNGSVRAGYGQAVYSKFDGGLNFNYAKEKYNIYGKYNAADRQYLQRAYINRNITYNTITSNYNQHSNTVGNPFGQNAKLGVDFYAKHDITWGISLAGAKELDKSNAINSTIISETGNDSTNELLQKNKVTDDFNNGALNFYFKQQYDTNGRELSASVDAIKYKTQNNQNFDLNYLDMHGVQTSSSELQRSDALSDINIFVGQIDYSHPLNKKYKLETGIKSSYVETSNDLIFDLFNNNIWENDTTRSNKFIYKETVNAGYLTGYADWGKLQIMAGLRAEQTISDGNSPTTGDHLKNSYVQLFPSVFILQKLAKNHALNLTYARRVNRPGYNSLNPFISYLDKYTYEQGNPFLQPEISNNLELAYSFMEALYVTVGAGRTNHAMTDVTNQVDSTGIGYKTTVNLNTVDNAYFGISTPIPIGNWFLAQIDLGEGYTRYNSVLFDSTYDHSSWSFSANSTFSFSLKKNFKIQTWAWYQAPGTYGIFQTKSKFGSGISISKNFFEKSLMTSIAVYDIFNTSGMRASINYQNQDVYIEFRPETPRVQFRVSYSFGNKKAQRKAEEKSGAEDLQNRTGK
ncbi:outer membrane beta-barrel family protein [soil metagenome]